METKLKKVEDSVSISPVTLSDLFSLSKFIPKFYEEFGQHPFGKAYDYDKDQFLIQWIDWLKKPNYVLLGAFDGDRIVGGLGGMYNPHPYNINTLIGIEHFWYVEPEYRKKGAGKKLIQSFEDWLYGHGVQYMMMLYIHGGPSEDLIQFYKKEGFKAFETQVIREVKKWEPPQQ